jgi:hypothetical protein
MSRIRRYVHNWIDNRHGKAQARYYFRRRGCKQIALPGAPGTPQFEEAYQFQRPLPGTPISPVCTVAVAYGLDDALARLEAWGLVRGSCQGRLKDPSFLNRNTLLSAWISALAGAEPAPSTVGARRVRVGTLDALILGYMHRTGRNERRMGIALHGCQTAVGRLEFERVTLAVFDGAQYATAQTAPFSARRGSG